MPTPPPSTNIASLLGPDKDVPAPDVNTDARVMAWVMDTISMFRDQAGGGVAGAEDQDN